MTRNPATLIGEDRDDIKAALVYVNVVSPLLFQPFFRIPHLDSCAFHEKAIGMQPLIPGYCAESHKPSSPRIFLIKSRHDRREHRTAPISAMMNNHTC
jgi:hypothetical protein